MKKEMRRKDRKLSEDEAYLILKKGDWGVLATFDGEYPYGVPVNYVFHNGSIYFHCAKQGYKLDNIAKNPNVCFTVVTKSEVVPQELSTNYESTIIFGKALVVHDENEKREALYALGKRFAKNYPEKVVQEIETLFSVTEIVKISIENISGKARKRSLT